MTTITSVAALRAAYPELCGQIAAESAAAASSTATDAALEAARAEGARLELARIQGIQAALIPGHEGLVARFIADGATTAGEAALAINAAERQARAGQLEGLRQDGAAAQPAAGTAAQPPVPPQTAAQILADKSRPVADRCKAAFDLDASIRDQHVTLGRFIAYQTALESGAVKLLRRA